ncbi:hypothetical protein FOG50_02066 [Hanseniaspora uvarum]|nr:hypothetical protein FOG50_02066 [Hanseniaspora uvarum]
MSSQPNIYLDDITLVECLRQAAGANVNPELAKKAEEQLKIWNDYYLVDGTLHKAYQDVYLDLSNDINIRWLAVINFKRIVEQKWKTIPMDVKLEIRSKILNNLDEYNKNLCMQNALAIRVMVRQDFPNQWESMLDDFNQVLTSIYMNIQNNPLNSIEKIKLYNVLLILNQIVKIVANARIGKCKIVFQEKSEMFFNILYQIYTNFSQIWISNLEQDSLNEDDMLEAMNISYICSKVLRVVITDGFKQPYVNESCNQCFDMMTRHFFDLIKNKGFFNQSISKYPILKKITIGFLKTLMRFKGAWDNDIYKLLLFKAEVVDSLIIQIIQFLNSNGEFIYVTDNESELAEVHEIFYKIGVYFFQLLKPIVQYCSPDNKITLTKYKSDMERMKEIKANLNTNIFSKPDFVLQSINSLEQYYLKLTQHDLELIIEDPEEWANEDLSSDPSFNIRKAGEIFFCTILSFYKENTEAILMDRLNSVDPSSTNDYLGLDALYTMFESSVEKLSSKADIDNIICNVLFPLVPFDNNSKQIEDIYKIVMIRRICSIISQWSENLDKNEVRQPVYAFLLKSLQIYGENSVVSSSVLQSITDVVSSSTFEKENFKNFISPLIEAIVVKVLPTVSLPHTKINALKSIQTVLSENRPLVEDENIVNVLKSLPNLWEDNVQNQSTLIVAQQLMRLTTSIIRSLNEKSYITWDLAFPMISQGIDSSSVNLERYNLLGEDAYDLLQEVLDCFPLQSALPEYYNKGMSLIGGVFLKNFMLSLENNTDLMPVLLNIFRLFAVVLPTDTFINLQEFKYVCSKMCSQLVNIRDDLFESMYNTWDHLLIKISFEKDESELKTQVLNWFVETGVYQALFKKIFLKESADDDMEDKCFHIISRLFFVNQDLFLSELNKYHMTFSIPKYENDRIEIIYQSSVYKEQSFSEVFQTLINKWYQCISLRIYNSKERKLNLLAISSIYKLLPKYEFYMLDKLEIHVKNFKPIASLWIEFLESVNEDNNGDCEKYHKIDQYIEQYMDLITDSFKIVKHNKKQNDIALKIVFKQYIYEIINNYIIADPEMGQLWNSGHEILFDDGIKDGLETFLK